MSLIFPLLKRCIGYTLTELFARRFRRENRWPRRHRNSVATSRGISSRFPKQQLLILRSNKQWTKKQDVRSELISRESKIESDYREKERQWGTKPRRWLRGPEASLSSVGFCKTTIPCLKPRFPIGVLGRSYSFSQAWVLEDEAPRFSVTKKFAFLFGPTCFIWIFCTNNL